MLTLRLRVSRLMVLVAAVSCIVLVGCTSQASASTSAVVEQKNTTANYRLIMTDHKPKKGEIIEVVVQSEGLVDAYAFEVSLKYDANKLKWLDAKSEVPGFSVKPIVEDGQATLAHTLIGKVAGLSGNRELFKVRFETIQSGQAAIVLQGVRIVDSKLASKTEQALASALLMIEGFAPFKDLAGYEWAEEAITALASEGIIKGTTKDTFSPGKLITRADFLLLLMRTLELEVPETSLEHRFADVEADAYYAYSVAMAAHLGIVRGDHRGLFQPAAPITRQDMMVMTVRALQGADRLSSEADMSVLQKYDDRAVIADYARESIAVLTELALVEGYSNNIQPKLNANRVQAAKMMYNIFSYIREQMNLH
ncbi:hypothetical protein EBB07_19010 [Paenibacillaceae bacterium]|nr:hypothetical protein EBB07_19010 [Paenibacillaceae bacterium]